MGLPDDWDRAAGVPCDRCGVELLKVHWVDGKPLCAKHAYPKDGVYFAPCVCYLCDGPAAKAIYVKDGLMDERVTCPVCGTHKPLNEEPKNSGNHRHARRKRKSKYREIEDTLKANRGEP